MGKKKSLSLIRFLRPFPVKTLTYSFVCQLLQIISSYCYFVTLEGGEVEYLKDNAGYFACWMITSIALTIISISLIYSQLSDPITYVNYILIGIQLFYTLTYDLGTDLQHHGQYNLLACFLIWIPIILGLIIYKTCKQIKKFINNDKKFWISLGATFIIIITYVYISLELALYNWYYGLGGKSLIVEQDYCNLEPPGYPWPGILPHRTLNFFTGSSQCPKVDHFSSLENGVLSINCDSEALIVERPDFVSMRQDMFVLTETGMERWNNRTKAMEKRYKVPGKSQNLRIKAEWFQVFCGDREDFYIQNVPKKEVIERLDKENKQRTVPPMNLVVIMMDTVSRSQVFRKMNNLVNVLETLNKTGENEVFQFFRIISNGFNTEYNTRAMYTGSQLRQNRSGRPYWDFMRGQGNVALYINGFCEDWMSVFLKKTFSGMDHAVSFPFCHFEYHPMEKTFGNFGGPFSILRRCINGKYVHKHIFEYVDEFWMNYKNYGKIIHIPLQEGHEGTGEVILTVDPDLSDFILDMKRSGKLDNTILVITSDHGSHMGPYFMATEMGAFEQKLPVLFFIYPTWFLNKYPEFRKSLLANEQKLVGHYDTHWTFRHLATLPEFGGEIKSNFLHEMNDFTDVWDCKKNLYFMEVAYQFKGKLWKKNLSPYIVTMIYRRIDTCFAYLKHTPKEYINLTNIPYDQVLEEHEDYETYRTLEYAMIDIDARYWFEDAYQDLSKQQLLGFTKFNGNEGYFQHNIDLENASWNTLKAPGRGRYLFGRSLMKYSDDRDCDQAGILRCVCSDFVNN
ncbi:unnamed protein product [Blepharisma stoltei]|uniref:Sulfatase N-terminal domain-containing protein n=1 Tax=Blepharisma stoltei TaxID=1481888 RepID=A0AAU9K2Y9_9CILI|nr:unnamed protein product [Blepharisma stoltei]